ncbi:MAG: hypothetical protein V3V48_10120, partial [Candidatus Aminicenantaceae bacterium]
MWESSFLLPIPVIRKQQECKLITKNRISRKKKSRSQPGPLLTHVLTKDKNTNGFTLIEVLL